MENRRHERFLNYRKFAENCSWIVITALGLGGAFGITYVDNRIKAGDMRVITYDEPSTRTGPDRVAGIEATNAEEDKSVGMSIYYYSPNAQGSGIIVCGWRQINLEWWGLDYACLPKLG